MDNILNLLSLLNSSQKKEEHEAPKIPKEILEQYPYGKFPIRYTKSGQESLRKESENRFSYKDEIKKEDEQSSNQNNFNLTELLPLLQLMSGKKDQTDMFKILSKMLFKDNKDLEGLFRLMKPSKPQELTNEDSFPDTNKVKISSLKRIN